MQGQALRRRLFGYRPEDVRRVLSDREVTFAQADERARIAAAKLQEAEAQLGTLGIALTDREVEISSLSEEVDDLRREVQELRQELEARPESAPVAAPSLTAQFLAAGLAPILGAAEEAATEMLEHVWESTEQQIAEAERMHGELRTTLSSVESWRTGLEPLVSSVQRRLRETREGIREVPHRVEQALAPLAGIMDSLGDDLPELMRASLPPALIVPPDEDEDQEETDLPTEVGEASDTGLIVIRDTSSNGSSPTVSDPGRVGAGALGP
jgi:chromosome segregation ATPase